VPGYCYGVVRQEREGSGRRHTYAPDLEIYGARYHPASADSVFHYAIPISDSIT
jgi:hypothetical protein